eukprot:11374227-Heterocapsa_arctica.AAC.1
MSKWTSAQRLLGDLRERAACGQRSLVWAALTCTPWRSWQNFNLKHSREPAVRRIESERSNSIHMIEILGWLINQVMTDDAVQPFVEFAFEWPRWCA